MKRRFLSRCAWRVRILVGGVLGLLATVAIAAPPAARPPDLRSADPAPPAAAPTPLPAPEGASRRLETEGTVLIGGVTPKGALVLVIDGEAAFAALERGAAASVAPGDTSLAPLHTAAERLGGALSGMDAALRSGDAGFFPALRDGCRALVELRTVARWLAVPPAVSEPLAQLTELFRDLRFHYGAEALRARQGSPLRAPERAEFVRLATAARRLQTRLAAPRRGPPAAPPPPPPVLRPGAPATSPATERLQLAGLIQLILVSPTSLGGYLESLMRTDVVLGTLAGEEPFRTGEPEAPLDSAANDLAASADTSLLFAANLSSGSTWNYMRQDASADSGAAALLESEPGELDPFDGDGSAAPVEDTAEQGQTPQPEAVHEALPEAPTPAQVPLAGAPMAITGDDSPVPPAAAVPGDAPPLSTDSAPPGGDPTAAEKLAKQLGGTVENGSVIIHGDAEGSSAKSDESDDNGAIPTQDIGTQEYGNLWRGVAAPAEGVGLPEDDATPWLLDESSLSWLSGAPWLCPLEPPPFPRCPA